jgi:hypothetical protein
VITRLLDAQAQRCSPFRVFFPLTFSDSLAAGHPNITVTALGGAGAGRRFFAGGAEASALGALCGGLAIALLWRRLSV